MVLKKEEEVQYNKAKTLWAHLFGEFLLVVYDEEKSLFLLFLIDVIIKCPNTMWHAYLVTLVSKNILSMNIVNDKLNVFLEMYFCDLPNKVVENTVKML